MSEAKKNEEMEEQPNPEVEWADDLNSDEISDLLGFDLSSEDGEDRSGLKALINSALVSHRRLPMLEVILDRAARQMTTSLRHLTNDNVEVALDDISSTRFGDFLESVSSPSVVGVLKAEGLGNYCLLAIDAALVYSVVDVLLGGRRGANALTIQDRGFTQIELGLVERVLELMAEDLTQAFKPVAEISFKLDRVETTTRFAAIAQDASVCSLAKFRIDMEERGGRALILTPHATLEPIHKLLLRDFINESGNSENAWRNHLAAEIAEAKLDLKAVVAEKEITIGALSTLTAGQTITFCGAANRLAEIRAGDMTVARGSVGRAGDAIAIRLNAEPKNTSNPSDAVKSDEAEEEAA